MFDEARNEESVGVFGGAEVSARAADWREADRALRRIAKRRAGLDAEEATWLLAAERAGVHEHFGYVSHAEYVERVLGYNPHTCAERMRVAHALELLPEIRAALASGAHCYSAVRELTRVAMPSTERIWLTEARNKTAHEIAELVAGRRRGALPDDPPEPDLRVRVIRMEATPPTFALYREVEQRLNAAAGRVLTDDETLDAMLRATLALVAQADAERTNADPNTPVPPETNTPPYQIALTRCVDCNRAWQDGAGRAIEVGPEVVAIAQCDAQVIGRVDGNTRERATRTIPPALRRQVLRRDHHRCIVPGCRASRWIAVHHLHERNQGGQHEASNCVSLCSSCHRALHRGLLSITGTPGAFQFWNADGTPWGSPPDDPDPTPTPRLIPAAQN